MRLFAAPALAGALLSTGCTALLVNTGVQPHTLTEERVKVEFPDAAATEHPDGTSALTFRTRRKIAEPNKVIYATMGAVATAGLGELVWFPTEVGRVVRTAAFGREVIVHYDRSGAVAQVTVGGEVVLWRTREEDGAKREPGAEAPGAP